MVGDEGLRHGLRKSILFETYWGMFKTWFCVPLKPGTHSYEVTVVSLFPKNTSSGLTIIMHLSRQTVFIKAKPLTAACNTSTDSLDLPYSLNMIG